MRAGELAMMGRARRGTRAVAAVAVLWAAGPSLAAVDFAPRVTTRVASGAAGLAVGDLNGDGLVDAAVSDGRSAVVVAQGDGTGRFPNAQPVPVGVEPAGIVLGDFTADRLLDLATADSGAGTVSILRAGGQGGPMLRTAVPVGQVPTTLSAADVDGDGDLDLATANLTSTNVSLLLGDGSGSFTPAFVNVGTLALDAVLSDATGDGAADLVVANGAVRILPGPWGGGSFGVPFEVATPTFPTRVAVADVDADGRPDIVAVNTFSNTASVFLGTGGSTFRRLAAVHASSLPSALAVADVNADGRLDVAVTNAGSRDVTVFEGTGGGRLRPGKQFRTGGNPTAIVAHDVTGDGRMDLLVANANGSVTTLRSRNLAPGGTGTAVVRTPCASPRRVILAESIGCVAVGMSQAQVREILGPPQRIRRAGRDYAFQYPRLLVSFLGESNQVDLVASERPGVGLANGLRVGASGALITRRLPRARCATRNAVRFCEHVRGERFTGFVDKGGIITEIDVGFVE